jgi:hypothetical protein
MVESLKTTNPEITIVSFLLKALVAEIGLLRIPDKGGPGPLFSDLR